MLYIYNLHPLDTQIKGTYPPPYFGSLQSAIEVSLGELPTAIAPKLYPILTLTLGYAFDILKAYPIG